MYKTKKNKIINSQTHIIFIIFMSSLSLTGCSSSTPITTIRTEYIPPITIAGKKCVDIINNELSSCNKGIQLETTVCQNKANSLAQENHARALENYTIQRSEQDKQRVEQKQKQVNHEIQQKQQYKNCLLDRERRDAERKQAYELWRINGSKGSPPYIKVINCSTPLPYYSNKNNYTATFKEPHLKDFIQDSHCFSENNECIDTYQHRYKIECTGNVIKTTRCFANCGDNK